MPAHYTHRFPRDLDLAIHFLQVDSSWYESYWLEERKQQPVGLVARNLPMIVSCLRLVWDRVVSVWRTVLPSVHRQKLILKYGTAAEERGWPIQDAE